VFQPPPVARNLPDRCVLLLLQSGTLILTNVWDRRRSSTGAHASPRKPNLAAGPEVAALRQIDRLVIERDFGRPDSNVDCCGFFGLSLFFIMPRSAKLTSGSSPESTNSVVPTALTPWPLEPTSEIDRLSDLASLPQPMGEVAAEKGGIVTPPASGNTPDLDPGAESARPVIARAADEPQAQPPLMGLGATSGAIGGPASAPLPEDPTPAAAGPARPRAPHPATHRKRTGREAAPPHPPLQAIHDLFQKHSHLFK
jgi:hypothetical protein